MSAAVESAGLLLVARSFNFQICGALFECLGEASYAVKNMPENVEQIFTDLGDEVYHGGARLRACASDANPCRQVGGTVHHLTINRQCVDA